jgi:release factor glutamine methyltransferase
MNIHSLLEQIERRLSPFSDTPQLDAQVLLAHVLDKKRTWLLAHAETPPSKEQLSELEAALTRLENGEALPYVLGHWEFFGLDLEVTPDVLIPRPETELLVEKAIVWLQASPKRKTIADVGTGSGAIAIALAMHVPEAYIVATDISRAALEVAKRNIKKFNLENQIDLIQCDLLPPHFDPLPTELHFDLICANLPYIPTDTLHNLPIYGREPTLALDGGKDGLDLVRRLLKVAPEWLAPRGKMLLEIEAAQGNAALALAYDAFSEAAIHLHQDLAGQDRLLEILLAGNNNESN